MKTIEIENDIHEYLLANVQEFGETPSDVLRKLLDIKKDDLSRSVRQPANELSAAITFLKSRMSLSVVDRFLYLLAVVAKQKPDDFHKVMMIQGTERKYFARSRKEIEQSGSSTQPRMIEGTGYWVMTNSPTRQKRAMLAEVLELLGYNTADIDEAKEMLSGGQI